uniref:Uncharacterized protein n=1 Tax=Coturnix japonica TaxID=93934 RepID=A0A8C2YAW7_COTJA
MAHPHPKGWHRRDVSPRSAQCWVIVGGGGTQPIDRLWGEEGDPACVSGCLPTTHGLLRGGIKAAEPRIVGDGRWKMGTAWLCLLCAASAGLVPLGNGGERGLWAAPHRQEPELLLPRGVDARGAGVEALQEVLEKLRHREMPPSTKKPGRVPSVGPGGSLGGSLGGGGHPGLLLI